MYKLLLCWRYLRTRWIALASIISVMLGVATMIVVNAVMAGFSHEMEDRMHGILSDVLIEGRDLNGFENPEWHMAAINQVAGQWIEGMTPTVHVPAMLNFRVRGGEWSPRQVMCIGIDERTHASVSDFGKYLQHPENRKQLTFYLRNGGYDVRDHQTTEAAPLRPDMEKAGWEWRKMWAQRQKAFDEARKRMEGAEQHADTASQTSTTSDSHLAPRESPGAAAESKAAPVAPRNPFDRLGTQEQVQAVDPASEQFDGVIIGIALASYRDHEGNDAFLLRPGDDVSISVPTTGTPPKVNSQQFTTVDLYESKMSEYDTSFVFVPIKVLQMLRGMGSNVTSIQIKLKPGVDGEMVRDVLRKRFPAEMYGVYTWRDKQGALLAAVQMEKAVLNILLFMIIAVAGFGILAIFFMIVVEKTRDVGILKSLGASSAGIMGIFLGYGLSLGFVGAGVGLAIGLAFVHYINQIRSAVEWITGQPVFDPAIYYFYKIPTIVEPFTVIWIVLGALLIAVLASVLPAFRAAGLHPVEALRYE